MPAPTIEGQYGPSPDFWPKNTLTRAQALALPVSSSRRKTVAFTKTAVQEAVNDISDADWDAGAVIFVQAGSNGEGSGAGAGSTSWLTTGRSGRKMRLLITPEGTFGSCAFTKSIVLDAQGVALGGFEFTAPKSNGLGRGILVRAATDSAIFNMWPLYYWGVQSVNNKATSNIELVNIVLPEGPLKVYTDSSFDSAAIRTLSNAPISNVTLTGVYEGPSFREKLPAGMKPEDAAHTDTRQISGGSVISNVRQKRSVTWGSTNAAIQSTGALTGYHFEDSLVIGGPSTNKRYPVPEGTSEWRADGSGTVSPNALNGGPTGCTAKGLIVIGTVGEFRFTSQSDSWISKPTSTGGQQPSTGPNWGLDTSLGDKPLSWFNTVAPLYTRAQIKAMFDNSNIVVPDDDYPTAPRLSLTSVTTSKVSLAWTAATDAEGPVSYAVERDGRVVAEVTGLAWENSGLPVATTYQYQVYAVDNADQRTGSNVLTVTTGSGTADTTPPTAPVLTVTNLKSTSGTLNWTASTDDIGVAGYDVMLDGKVVQRVSSTARTLAATGLTPNTDYDVAVIAFDAAGNRTTSELLTVTTPPNYDTTPPTVFTVTATATDATTITASCTASVDGGGASQLITYQWILDGQNVGTAGTTRTRVFTVDPATTHTVEAVASDTDGNSRASNEVTVTTPGIVDNTPPTAPTIGTPTVGFTSITYSWAGASDNVEVAGYDAYMDGVKVNSELLRDPSCVVSGLLPGRQHVFHVVAKDAAGNSSPQSNSVVATTLSDSTAPVAAWASPAAGAQLDSRVPLRITASDADSGIANVRFYDGADTFIGTGSMLSEGIYGIDVSRDGMTFVNDAITLYAKVWDRNDNVATTAPRSFVRAAVVPVDTTPPTGGITDPPAGTVVVPPFQRVRVSASDPQSGIGSVSLRTSTLGELAPATRVSPGIYEADLPVGQLAYGSTSVFARIVNGVGLVFDTPAVAVVRETPVQTGDMWVDVAPPLVDASGEPIRNGKISIAQRLNFGSEIGLVVKEPVYVDVIDGDFYINGLKKNIRLRVPPESVGFDVTEEGSNLPYRKWIAQFPSGTEIGSTIEYKDLREINGPVVQAVSVATRSVAPLSPVGLLVYIEDEGVLAQVRE